MHLAYIWIISHLSAKNYRNLWKFDEVLTKTNLLSFFGTRCRIVTIWNSLPNAVVYIDSVDSFKSRLDNFWISQDVKYDKPTL